MCRRRPPTAGPATRALTGAHSAVPVVALTAVRATRAPMAVLTAARATRAPTVVQMVEQVATQVPTVALTAEPTRRAVGLLPSSAASDLR